LEICNRTAICTSDQANLVRPHTERLAPIDSTPTALAFTRATPTRALDEKRARLTNVERARVLEVSWVL
jgi:hypothetical protein